MHRLRASVYAAAAAAVAMVAIGVVGSTLGLVGAENSPVADATSTVDFDAELSAVLADIERLRVEAEAAALYGVEV